MGGIDLVELIINTAKQKKNLNKYKAKMVWFNVVYNKVMYLLFVQAKCVRCPYITGRT